MQKYIAYFGYTCGYSKQETLELYEDEIPILIKEVEKLRSRDRILLAMELLSHSSMVNSSKSDKQRYRTKLERELKKTGK